MEKVALGPDGFCEIGLVGSPEFLAPELAEAAREKKLRARCSPFKAEIYTIGLMILHLVYCSTAF